LDGAGLENCVSAVVGILFAEFSNGGIRFFSKAFFADTSANLADGVVESASVSVVIGERRVLITVAVLYRKFFGVVRILSVNSFWSCLELTTNRIPFSIVDH